MLTTIDRTTALRSRVALAASLCALAIGACGDPPPKREWTPDDHGQPETGDPDRTPLEDRTPEGDDGQDPIARAAAALWNASCASCHGRDGRGQGPGRPPGVQMADFSAPAFQSSRSDDQLTAVIRDGRGVMPAFGKQVNEHGIDALVRHIRGFGAGEGAAGAEPSTAQPR